MGLAQRAADEQTSDRMLGDELDESEEAFMILRTSPGTGDWTVVVVGDAVLAVADPGRVDDLAARLAEGFGATRELLVGDRTATAPGFALVDAAGGVARVVLRGAAELEAGAERVSGAGAATWAERVLDGAGELRLRVPGSAWILRPGGASPADLAREAVAAPASAPRETDPHPTIVPGPEAASGASRFVGASEPEPGRPSDRVGRGPLAGAAAEATAAVTASGPVVTLELPDGGVEPLTAPLLVGRSPSDPGHDASGGPRRLVVVAEGDKGVSRTHARIEAAGGAVVVTDLDSRNGTSVTLPGAAPRRLRAGEPAVVLPDTVIDLGGGVTITVRESA